MRKKDCNSPALAIPDLFWHSLSPYDLALPTPCICYPVSKLPWLHTHAYAHVQPSLVVNHPIPCPPSPLSNNDSFASDSPWHCYHFLAGNMTGKAHLEQSAENKLPILSSGDLSLEELHKWEMGCHQYFKVKTIATENQVSHVTWNL